MIDLLRKSKQWFIRCILPQLPHKLPGALPSPDPSLQDGNDMGDESAARGHIDVPLVRDQLKRAELVKAARIYKLGENIKSIFLKSPFTTTNPDLHVVCVCGGGWGVGGGLR